MFIDPIWDIESGDDYIMWIYMTCTVGRKGGQHTNFCKYNKGKGYLVSDLENTSSTTSI